MMLLGIVLQRLKDGSDFPGGGGGGLHCNEWAAVESNFRESLI